ncbi:hypothetical protein [Deinococcus sp. 12RED42]|uniref:hypothetical protein n=1 Tax=Deinococcus sp. 12RED42 TaxID=2745872 RepID=UPI001E64E07D|nr:hypothetical protein [Deinococcus sp. 12RED42]MCD0166556.1 hypothetical protein [Deinococcus sp. 12RED42]
MTLDWKALKREARKQGTSAERLAELVALGPELSREVARGQHTPPQVLQALASHPDPLTVEAVASNPHTPPQILEALSLKTTALAKKVAHNKSTPGPTLERLGNSQSDQIREAVSFNPSAPLHVLMMLRDDPNAAVSDHLLLRSMGLLDLYGKAKDVPAEKLVRAMALTDLIPAEAAARLSECSDPHVQLGLLENIDKVALSVRNEIRQRLLSKEPTHDHP